jgi:hypothetical protein
MIYSISLLTTRPDCLALIELANREKTRLAYRKMGFDIQRQSATLTSQEIETSLLTTSVQLQALQTVHDSLPEGPAKQEIFNDIRMSEHKKFMLEQRKENYGVLALLEKEFNSASIDRGIVEADDYIQQLTDRMNDISKI